MTMNGPAYEALLNAKAKYEADGYAVSVKERLSKPSDAFTTDAVARRDDEFVVVEVKSANMSDWSRKRLEELTEILRADCGWRLDIITYEPDVAPPLPDLDHINRRVQEAQHIAETSPDGASLLLWSAIEGALLRAAHERGVAPARPLPTRSLIQQLTIDGVLSDNQSRELKDFADRRNAIAHGLCAVPPSPEQFDWLSRFALSAAAGHHADLHDMVVWFEAHYASPDEAGVPHVSDVGGYLWLDSGPHNAEDVLRGQFEDALDADVDEAVRIIERDGLEWARRDQL